MIAILGAGGPIGEGLAQRFAAGGIRYRNVSRTPTAAPGGESVSADLSDAAATLAAVDGCDTVCLVAGLKYDIAVWRELWPRIMSNVIAACSRKNAKLLFFDNVYSYGLVEGEMTETTPYRPVSKKGAVRAGIAAQLTDQVRAGNLTAMIARCADFFGLRVKNSVPNQFVFEPYSKGGTASWLGRADVPHSLTFVPDAVRGVTTLLADVAAWNQIWHLPTAPNPLTGAEFMRQAAAAFDVPAKHRVIGRFMLTVAGWFNADARESVEMLYQWEAPYRFSSSKFATAFGFGGTPYAESIRATADAYKLS